MAVNFADCGCKVIAPSDMMDGRVKIIRENLEKMVFLIQISCPTALNFVRISMHHSEMH